MASLLAEVRAAGWQVALSPRGTLLARGGPQPLDPTPDERAALVEGLRTESARALYPHLGREVETPHGRGVLHQVLDHRALVAVPRGGKTVGLFLDPLTIRPDEGPR